MLTIFYGEDTAASRQAFSQLISPETVQFSGDTVTITDLLQVLEGGGLFNDPKTVAIEDLLSKRKKSSELDSLIDVIAKEKTHHILLWEGKDLTASTLGKFKQAEIKKFALPQTLFQFLDSLKPNNASVLIKLFHETQQSTPTEMIVFMITRHVRLLLAVASQPIAQIEEVKRLAPWQKTKLERQARLFSKTALLSLHEQLFRIDLETKTGASTIPLQTRIDFFLSSL